MSQEIIQEEWQPKVNPWIMIIPVMVAVFIYVLDGTIGLAMIPLMNLSVETLRNDQMTNATGLQNLLKNIGGAIGTSLVATMLTRFAQVHQFMLVGKLNDLNTVFVERVQATTGALASLTETSMAINNNGH